MGCTGSTFSEVLSSVCSDAGSQSDGLSVVFASLPLCAVTRHGEPGSVLAVWARRVWGTCCWDHPRLKSGSLGLSSGLPEESPRAREASGRWLALLSA